MLGTVYQRVTSLSVLTGIILTVIGLRFWFVPDSATLTFGLDPQQPGNSFERVIALRDVWLGLLAIAFALLSEWRALSLWFGLGALVCWADATLVVSADGPMAAIAFHAASGVFCLVLAVRCWQLYKRASA